MRQSLISGCIALALLIGLMPMGQAAESAWVSSGMAQARILTPANGIVDGQTLDVGVELKLPKG